MRCAPAALLVAALLSAPLASCAGLGERFAAEELWLAEAVAWEEVAPVFEGRCVTCHADPPLGGASFALRTYAEVAPWVERVRVRVVVQGDMPPGGLQDPAERDLLARWLAQGARGPEAGAQAGAQAGSQAGSQAGAGAEAGATPPAPTWDGEVRALFDIYCNNCHAPTPTGGAPFPLTTYAEAAPFLARFEARVIERMDMPPGGVRDAGDLATIEAWLRAGGPER